LPLLIWFALYALLVRWTVARVGPASKAASDARSEVTGRVVDSYTNIHSVKMFAHDAQELGYAREAIEETRRTFQIEMRIFTIMDAVLVALNGLLIVSVVDLDTERPVYRLSASRRRPDQEESEIVVNEHFVKLLESLPVGTDAKRRATPKVGGM